MGKAQRLGVEVAQPIHTHESKDIISVVGNSKEEYMKEVWKDYDDKYKVSNTGRVINKITKHELNHGLLIQGTNKLQLLRVTY